MALLLRSSRIKLGSFSIPRSVYGLKRTHCERFSEVVVGGVEDQVSDEGERFFLREV